MSGFSFKRMTRITCGAKTTTTRPMTKAEEAAFDKAFDAMGAAFSKMDDAFAAMDKAFKDTDR